MASMASSSYEDEPALSVLDDDGGGGGAMVALNLRNEFSGLASRA